MTISILIVDDYRVVREGLRALLVSDEELQIVAEASDGLDAVEQARRWRPDVVLMDAELPAMDGIEATAIIRQDLPTTEVLVLTETHAGLDIIKAIRAGAIGYLLKNAQATDLRTAIRAAAAGQVYLSPVNSWLAPDFVRPSISPSGHDFFAL
ncbi:hypothetical protein KDW_49540 [Dictyobacter vulcani]|uniref:Response regulatory domain-containing protein n=1 Tax=Dictyobacter vulcani TaxID=2607529 RepID=A0A5J4KNV9_9CHLR|nr:response regulator transcription factor [Dictyobacter vulcani]GER89535.1 hypothetical protein KDW_36970 [Dictyobacter vulcani]GER90792.1 hypothetical protein KDW_49540 [Dictyobacter vulcani]